MLRVGSPPAIADGRLVGWGWDDDEESPRVKLASREAENGVRQARYLSEVIRTGLASEAPLRLAPAIIGELNRLAVQGVVPTAGQEHVAGASDLDI
jgi:hypothetical protein